MTSSLAPGSPLGHYQVIGLLGAGGMGEVYRARDTRLGREVALKVLPPVVASDPERLARFEREAHLLASLNHPHIASIYGVVDTGTAPALVLELVEGQTLEDRIAKGALPLEEAVPIARQIAEALEYAHEHGVIHRDLKPANIKLDAEGRVKVLDFGLAKAMSGDPGGPGSDPSMSPTLTSLGSAVGMILGTAAYMSPEQARGATVDRRADIWAFGAVVFEMLTASRGFEGDTVSDTLASVLRAPVEWEKLPPSTPPAVVRLLKRCLERDAKKRLRDIGEARIVLETLHDAPEPTAATAAAPAAVAPARPIWRTALPWALFALTAIVAAVALRPRPMAVPDVLRFQVSVPPAMARITWPRLSPDGRTILFQARDKEGKSTIWVRSLDAFEAHPLSGTENVTRPFWSPDGRSIAFFSGKQLMKMPVSGGPAQLVCEAVSGSDGSWGASGVIVFDGNTSDPIRRCPAGGGPVAVAVAPQAGGGDVISGWPFFLPDGRHFLLQTRDTKKTGAQEMISVASIDDATLKPLIAADSRAEYANGHLIYVLRNVLVAQLFDPVKMEVTGDPIPIAPNVSQGDPGLFSVSETASLVFMGTGAGARDQLVWVDRQGHEISNEGPPGTIGDLALSPDGGRLAYSANDGTQSDIWVRDLRRGTAMRLTSDTADETWPVWSPDGSHVVYSSNKDGAFALMMKPASGTGAEEPLHAAPGVNLGADQFAPDGHQLLFTSFASSSLTDLSLLSLSGPSAHQATALFKAEASERGGKFSPDGRFLAYFSDETGRREVYVQPFPPTGAKWTISTQEGFAPQWRGDGKELFYRGANDTIWAVPISLSPTFDAGTPQQLFTRTVETSGTAVRTRWVVTPDGQRFLFNTPITGSDQTPFSVVVNWPQALAHE